VRFKSVAFFFVLLTLTMAAHACHVGILWAEESLPLAAARQMFGGKILYRDVWFDKPPSLVLPYLLSGAHNGWPLRIAGCLYLLLACWIAYRFATEVWSAREGMWAAGLLAFFLTFDFPSAVIPLASDLLLVAPHLAAIWLAWKQRPFWSGALAGVAFLVNPKAVLLAAACALWNLEGVPMLTAGFAAVNAIVLGGLWVVGAFPAYWQEVWQWGSLYASAPPGAASLWNGVIRTVNWAGFHIALIIASGYFFARSKGMQWVGWWLFCAVGVAAGFRFYPRYYFLLLPPLVVAAARGLTLLGRRGAWVVLLLSIPFIRFAPRYFELAAGEANWTDTAMDRDSRLAARITRGLARPNDTLFVWGFRPELYAYTRLSAATRFLDSQPLTGVPADRHLTESTPLETAPAAARRRELAQSHPAFVMDGLGPYNPQLAITSYPELRHWLDQYDVVGRTAGTVIYARADISGTRALAAPLNPYPFPHTPPPPDSWVADRR
jgi:hypothetical protein